MQFSRPLRLSVLFTTIQGHSAVSVASNFRSLALSHDYFHAGPIVPAPVENDDFTGTREVLDKTLAVNLCLFPIRRSSQRHYPEHAGADSLGYGLDYATLARGITVAIVAIAILARLPPGDDSTR
jgi:hypothetical protein